MKPHRLDKFVHKRARELGYRHGEVYDLVAKWDREDDMSFWLSKACQGKTTYKAKENGDSITITRHTDDSNYEKIVEACHGENAVYRLLKGER